MLKLLIFQLFLFFYLKTIECHIFTDIDEKETRLQR